MKNVRVHQKFREFTHFHRLDNVQDEGVLGFALYTNFYLSRHINNITIHFNSLANKEKVEYKQSIYKKTYITD